MNIEFVYLKEAIYDTIKVLLLKDAIKKYRRMIMEDYEQRVDAIQKQNKVYLDEFKKYLVDKGIKKKTIDSQLSDIDFYINEYLCYYEPQDVETGCYEMRMYYTDWFIRKAMWAKCSTIKSTSVSIRKFYKYLSEMNVIEADDYENLVTTIKDEMPAWLEGMETFDNALFL